MQDDAQMYRRTIFLLVLFTTLVALQLGNALAQDSRPDEFQKPVLTCAKTVPVFFDDPNFLLGYTLQEPEADWLPDQLIWKSREGAPSSSGRQGETRVAIYKKSHFGSLQARFKKLIDFNFEAETLREIHITLQAIVIETLRDPEPVRPNLGAALLSRPYVRTLVRADAITIVAIRENGVKADLSLLKKLIPFFQSTGAEADYRWDDNKKAITLGKRVYFQACKSFPRSDLDVTKNPLIIRESNLSDTFRIRNLSNQEIEWFLRDFPSPVFLLAGHPDYGRIPANSMSDMILVKGQLEHLIAQKVNEYEFVISSYDEINQKYMKITTVDPNELRTQIYNRYIAPSAR